jgi:hypothetical protein
MKAPQRCWPGCLAIVRTEGADCRQHSGSVVECVRLLVRANGDRGWITAPELYTTRGHRIIWYEEALTPITPPPGFVTNGEVQELYQPKRDEVTA